MQVVYFLPKYNFFRQNLRGRTSHAHGFLTGLRQNAIDCLLISGPGYQELYDNPGLNNRIFKPRLLSRINLLWVVYAAIGTLRDKAINAPGNVLVVRYSTSAAWLTSLLFGLFWKGKTVYEINSLCYHQLAGRPAILLQVVLALEKRLLAAFDIALCVSRNISLDIQHPKIKSFVMPNGSSTLPAPLKNFHRNKPRFVYLGAYQPYYDFKQLFRCFLRADTCDGELHIYGDRQKYLAIAPELADHDRIKLKGTYNLKDLLNGNVFSRCDIFILPNGRNSMSRIGSPTKLFEYLAFGNRIIYLDFAQAGEILNGLSGVYPYRDDDTLIEALEKLAKQFNQSFTSPMTAEEYLATCTWEARVGLFRDCLAAELAIK